MRHPILKSVLVALIPIGYRSISNDRTITVGGYRSSTDIFIPIQQLFNINPKRKIRLQK